MFISVNFICLSVPRNCSESEWRCENKRCISQSQRCNKINDCGDWTDEMNCTGDLLCDVLNVGHVLISSTLKKTRAQ